MSQNQNIDWETILSRIKAGRCTPFLGSAANYEIIPDSLGGDLAKHLAQKSNFQARDCNDLIRVSQYMAIIRDQMVPKEEVLALLNKKIEDWEKTVNSSDFFKKSDEPLGILAELPFHIYITTNYDDLMARALKAWSREPRREMCRWNDKLMKSESLLDPEFEPNVANPLVFHLHGYDENPQSLVLTEDDYIDFLVNISADEQKLLPHLIQRALCGTSLIFIGYALQDWNFRVLFRGLVESMEKGMRYTSVSVQLPSNSPQEKEYLVRYFRDKKVDIYEGTAKEFAVELRDRWREFSGRGTI